MSETVRIGIVGVGGMGGNHAKRILEGEVTDATLAAVADSSPERLAQYPEQEQHADAKTLFESKSVDAVLIATPHFSHVPLASAALEAGKHVLLEKPVGVHYGECEALNRIAEKSDRVFGAMFNQRTDPKYRKLKKLISSGELGAISRAEWVITDWFRTDAYYNSADWRGTWGGEGGGVLLNQAPHQLDLWQWLLGLPESVTAIGGFGRKHDIEVEDEITALMPYADGSHGVFITSTGEWPGTNRFEVLGDKAKATLEGTTLTLQRNKEPVSEFIRTTENIWSSPEVETETFTFENGGEQHLGIMKNFAQAILGREELIAPGIEGIRSVNLGNAMLLSALEKRTVNLPVDGAHIEQTLNKLKETSRWNVAKV